MDFAEVVEALRGLPGRTVEVSVGVPDDGGEVVSVAGFSGRVREVRRSSLRDEVDRWYVRFEDDGMSKPNHGHVLVCSNTFEDASVSGSGRSLEEAIEEDNDEIGSTWDLVIRQLGVVVEITIYV